MQVEIGSKGLKAQFARSESRRRWRAFMLTVPLLLFIGVTFLFPVVEMLFRSVDNEFVYKTLLNTREVIKNWDGQELPSDEVFTAMYSDLKAGVPNKAVTRLGQRLNYKISGVSSVFRKTARQLKELPDTVEDARTTLIGIHEKWGDVNLWRGIQFFADRYTTSHYLDALDFDYDIEQQSYVYPELKDRLYTKLFWRTIVISTLITFLTFLLGYPVAFLIANLPSRTANILLIFVLLPFWTSLLVRTTSWIVLLYKEGVINSSLIFFGLVEAGQQPELIHNKIGTVVAMTHILLPFMILPLYSVMKTIPPTYMRAARSMGADAFTAFRRIYFPQTLPGIGAGAILVFILAIGYYITPELVGGAEGTFISNRIAYHIRSSGNWGLAAALGFMLLALVLALYWCYDKVVGIDKMKLG